MPTPHYILQNNSKIWQALTKKPGQTKCYLDVPACNERKWI